MVIASSSVSLSIPNVFKYFIAIMVFPFYVLENRVGNAPTYTGFASQRITFLLTVLILSVLTSRSYGYSPS